MKITFNKACSATLVTPMGCDEVINEREQPLHQTEICKVMNLYRKKCYLFQNVYC